MLDVWAGADNLLALGDETVFGHAPRVQLRGGEIEIGAWTQIRDGVVLKCSGSLSVGEWVLLSHGAMIHCSEAVTVADRVGIAERVSLIDSDHGVDGSDVHYRAAPLRTTPVTVGRNALISANAVLLRGTTVGPNAVIGAGAVLTGGDYPGGWLIGGVPARPLRALGAAPT